ncbi:MAG: hypothetical protein AAB263_11865, partial [Planctomycetota bacterium]
AAAGAPVGHLVAVRIREIDATVALNGGNPDPDIMFFRYWHSTGNLQKVAAFNAPEIDKLLETGRSTADAEKRKLSYNDIQKKLAEAVPWVWLYVGFEYRPTILLGNILRGSHPMG